MRWRNGRGETREIAAWPAGSTLDSFEWRVSIATIVEDVAFSRFPGVARTTVLLSGAGLRLAGAATRIELARRHAVATYHGDEEVHCRPQGGVVQVLNVMVRGRGRAQVCAIDAGTARVAPARFRVCVAAEGTVQCAMGVTVLTMAPGDAVVVDDADEAGAMLAVHAQDGGSTAIVASIDEQGTA
jgi:environmental stress-induced protein Ves